ncbi:MAG: hypothetical protein ACKOZZ_16315 [Bacteroidota bacterium]
MAMKHLYGNHLWEGIITLLEIIFSETHRFPDQNSAIHLSSDLRDDILFVAFQYAHTEEGIISPENLLPFFRIECRLKKMGISLFKGFEEKWMNMEKYNAINQKIRCIEGQITFRINQFSNPAISYAYHHHNQERR